MSHNLLKDLRHAVRTLWQNPGFTAVAVLSLALGIGVNTAIFSLINALLLRTLPVEDPGRLVMVSDPNAAGVNIGTQGGDRSLFTCEEFARMRQEQQAVRAFPLRIGIGKVRADISRPRRAKQRIAERMRDHVTVRMPHRPFIKRHFDAADDEFAAFREAVQVVADAAAHAHAFFCSSCR
jgi:hypothetical protein